MKKGSHKFLACLFLNDFVSYCHAPKKERHLYRGQRHMVNLKKFLLWTNEVLPRGRFSWQYLPNFCLKKRKIKGVLWTSYFINGKKISNLSLLDVRELVNRPSTPICDCWLGLFYTWSTKTKNKHQSWFLKSCSWLRISVIRIQNVPRKNKKK